MKRRYMALALAAMAIPLRAEPSKPEAIVVGATPIRLSAPNGYVSPAGKSEDFWRTVEKLMPQKSHLLAAYIDEADALRFEQNGAPDFRRYFMVQAMRSTEGHSYAEAEFASMKDSMRSHFYRNKAYTSVEVQEFFDSRVRQINKQLGADLLSMRLGEQRLLEIFDESQDSLSVLAIQKSSLVAGDFKDDMPKVMSVSYVKLQDKVIFFFAYSPLRSGADMEWVRKETRQWVANNVAINARPNPIERTSSGLLRKPPGAAQLER